MSVWTICSCGFQIITPVHMAEVCSDDILYSYSEGTRFETSPVPAILTEDFRSCSEALTAISNLSWDIFLPNSCIIHHSYHKTLYGPKYCQRRDRIPQINNCVYVCMYAVVQTDPGAHPASSTMGFGYYQEGKAAWAWR